MKYPSQFPRRSASEYRRAERSGLPWTQKEDDTILEYYEDMGPTPLMKLIPGRTANSISVRAKMMGVIYKKTKRKEIKEAKDPQEEKDIITSEIKFLIETICGDDSAKKTKALAFLALMEEANSAQWWSERRHWRLGSWCEIFIPGYEYRTQILEREAFLDGDGVFIEKGGSDYAFYGRNG